MKNVIVAFFLSTSLCLTVANANEYRFEISPVLGGVKPEGNRGLEDQLFYGLKFAVRTNSDIVQKVRVGFEGSTGVKAEDGSGNEVNIFRATGNLIHEKAMTKYFRFYFLLGGGFEKLSKKVKDIESMFYGNYGLGLDYYLLDNLSIQSEFRHGMRVKASNNSNPPHNFFYSIALAYKWGEIAQEQVPENGPYLDIISDKMPPPLMDVEEVSNLGDDDQDTVLNNMDECPNTPRGVMVGANGCVKSMTLHIKFSSGGSTIVSKYDSQIDKVANFMKKYPAYKVTLEGYTDATGSNAYNVELSDKRSYSVARALRQKGVEAERISTVGYGSSKPIATNKTEKGRAKNRRVDAVFSY